ncbi:MAG: hypothetical protein Q9212_002466 [Teloschistes hypoglaucus]
MSGDDFHSVSGGFGIDTAIHELFTSGEVVDKGLLFAVLRYHFACMKMAPFGDAHKSMDAVVHTETPRNAYHVEVIDYDV